MAASLGQRASRPLRLCRDCHRWRNGGSRGAFLEALSLMRSITLPLVRARGRALQNCVRTAQGQSYRESIGVKPSGSGCLRARRMLSHWRGLPRRPLANGGAEGLLTLRVQTVLQCAPRARTKGGALAKHTAKRFQKPFGLAKGPAKGLRFALNFFQLFSPTPLRAPLAFATLVTVSNGPGLPKRRGQPPFPFGLKGKTNEKANVCNGPRSVRCGFR